MQIKHAQKCNRIPSEKIDLRIIHSVILTYLLFIRRVPAWVITGTKRNYNIIYINLCKYTGIVVHMYRRGISRERGKTRQDDKCRTQIFAHSSLEQKCAK